MKKKLDIVNSVTVIGDPGTMQDVIMQEAMNPMNKANVNTLSRTDAILTIHKAICSFCTYAGSCVECPVNNVSCGLALDALAGKVSLEEK